MCRLCQQWSHFAHSSDFDSRRKVTKVIRTQRIGKKSAKGASTLFCIFNQLLDLHRRVFFAEYNLILNNCSTISYIDHMSRLNTLTCKHRSANRNWQNLHIILLWGFGCGPLNIEITFVGLIICSLVSLTHSVSWSWSAKTTPRSRFWHSST